MSTPKHYELNRLVSELTTSLSQAEEEIGLLMREAILSKLTHDQEIHLAKLLGQANTLMWTLGRLEVVSEPAPKKPAKRDNNHLRLVKAG